MGTLRLSVGVWIAFCQVARGIHNLWYGSCIIFDWECVSVLQRHTETA